MSILLLNKTCKECGKKYSGQGCFKHLHGKNNPRYGAKLSKRTKRLIGIKSSQKIMSIEARRKIGLANKDKKLSKEARRNMSLAKMGPNNPNYDKFGKDHPSYGRKHYKSSINKMRKAAIKRSDRISKWNKKNWRKGVYDNSPMGIGKVGFREDLGHNCRSTWEANFARILNYKGIKYEYEKHRLETPYGLYIPDFAIPSKGYFIEVKGYEIDNKQKKKRDYVNIHYGIIYMVRRNKYIQLRKKYKKRINKWE